MIGFLSKKNRFLISSCSNFVNLVVCLPHVVGLGDVMGCFSTKREWIVDENSTNKCRRPLD